MPSFGTMGTSGDGNLKVAGDGEGEMVATLQGSGTSEEEQARGMLMARASSKEWMAPHRH